MLFSVKVSTNNVDRAPEDAHHESRLSRQIASACFGEPCASWVEVSQIGPGFPGPMGPHLCLVYELMWEPLWLLQRRMI